MSTPIKNVDVVVIGGGPVGLINAIETAYLGHRVVVLEGRDEYTRDHLVKLHASSFKGISKDSPLQPIVAELKKNPNIPTLALEKKLIDIAKQCGVDIRHAYVRDPLALSKSLEFANTKIFIGADGRWSKVREKVFGDKLRYHQELAYVAQIKYKVQGQGRALDWLRYGYATQKLMQAPVFEFVGKEKGGKTSITTQITIDAATFEQMKHASTGKAYQWDTQKAKIPESIQRCVEIWLNAKAKITGEQPVPDSIKISVIPLSAYSSRTIVKVDETTKKIWAVVGDAAAGLPLMQGLNHGARCAIRLASTSHQHLTTPSEISLNLKGFSAGDAAEGNVPKVFKSYASYVRHISVWETFVAHCKNFFITFYGWWIYLSSLVPWQSNKWNAQDALVLRTAHLKKDLD